MEEDHKGNAYNCEYKFREGEVRISLEGVEVLRVLFNSENFARGLFENLKQGNRRFISLSEEMRRKMHERVRERYTQEGLEANDELISKLEEQTLRELEIEFVKDSIEISRNMVSEKLTDFVIAFWEKLLNLATFTGANALRDLVNLPEQKYSTKMIETSLYRLERERLKALIGSPTTRGGAHNVKHDWTDDERACLVAKYEELRPIWIEAKRLARDAQKSRERPRKKEWRNEVLRAYPQLPADLLERFSSPRADDAKPADIAVIHAKRECGVTEDYTPRHLRDQIKAWKLKPTT
jgi:hypothetical protein